MTLAEMLARCVEDGDCLVWTGICSKGGVPKINILPAGKTERTVLSARRVVWELAKGPIPAKRLVTVTCGCSKCLNPEHLKLTTRAQVATLVGARLDVKLKKGAALSAGGYKAKLTRDQAMDILASDKDTKTLSEEYGIGIGSIQRIKRRESFKDYANPFAGLGA
jgi:hypothetical protein